MLTVFTETDSWLAISGRERFVGRYLSTRNSLGLSCSISANADSSPGDMDSPGDRDDPRTTSRISVSRAG